MYWLTSFKSGDIDDIEYKRNLIDTLVNSVFLYDTDGDGRKLVVTYNLSGNNVRTIKCSDIDCYTALNSANPNTLFLVKHCFGFVIEIEGV